MIRDLQLYSLHKEERNADELALQCIAPLPVNLNNDLAQHLLSLRGLQLNLLTLQIIPWEGLALLQVLQQPYLYYRQ